MLQQSEPRYPDRLRLPLAFDPAKLRADLDRIAGETWIAHFVPQNYDGDWSVLPLRGVAGATHPVMMIYADPSATEFADGPLLAVMPYVREVLRSFGCPLQCVRLMRLTPGSRILEHVDPDLAAEQGFARIHVPITTGPRVTFMLNGVPVAMMPGEAWYLRLADRHAVTNDGVDDRVHLVIDCVVDTWLTDLLERSGAAARAGDWQAQADRAESAADESCDRMG